MKKVLIVLLVLALLAGLGMLLFHHFVTNRITDWDGMENPEYSEVVCHPNHNRQTISAQNHLQEEHNGTV